ncbi:DUF4192 domain-containing protein [Virgisporangium aurantiacum]|uniref:DUF4192 domain-containing protein n=1 Tax=Virgisporangium aurantiacum TaxID=175570 RepID=A0A8J3ZIF3_9ACTN|nr:DUF4192 domain-containing protein [Virgisporangium aurantiacum]GIJ64469.1 hypothetical protein Vau01_119850 [Virgisporangium aurantiacum]
MSDPTQVNLSGPIDLIALVPHLLGYQPDDGDIVVLGMREDIIVMTACTDFGDVPVGLEQQAVVGALAGPVGHARIDAAAVVGYGEPEHIGAAMDSLRDFLSARDIRIVDAIRVFGGRYYPHIPAGWETLLSGGMARVMDGVTDGVMAGVMDGVMAGVPFDTATAAVTAAMVHSGSMAQPNRAAVAEQFLPVTGTERADMHAATLRARHRLQHMTGGIPDPAAAIEHAGRTAAALVYGRHRNGDRITDDEAAWLTVLLTDTAVRDHVWRHTHGHHGHLTLWTDLTRRAEPDLVAAPASLLACAAWRMGNGTIANIALDRALDADPTYKMARLLQVALSTGMPPTVIGERFRLAEDPLDPNGSDAD